jgi:uncharacterized protein (DUF2237 family)
MSEELNVLGTELQKCCIFPMTGFFRDGYCRTCDEDEGLHIVCVEVTEEFLKFSLETGNDLTAPIKQFDFPGLIPGDRWCLCAERWVAAYNEGVAPPVILAATHQKVLELIPLEVLIEFGIDEPED